MDEQFTRISKQITKYYQDMPVKPRQGDWITWVDNLKEPMKTGFKKLGFVKSKNSIPFLRFFLESQGHGLRDYLKQNLSEEDFTYYKDHLS